MSHRNEMYIGSQYFSRITLEEAGNRSFKIRPVKGNPNYCPPTPVSAIQAIVRSSQVTLSSGNLYSLEGSVEGRDLAGWEYSDIHDQSQI